MNKDEQKFATKVVKFLRHNKHLFPNSYKGEVKIVRRGFKAFPFSELSEKERRLLLAAKYSGLVQTNSDYGGMGTLCDLDCVRGGGLIFLQFYKRANKEFYVIDIDDFLYEMKISTRKSLTEERANIIGKKLILGKLYK